MNVFCWLGWNEATRWYGPISTSAPWPKRGLGEASRGPARRLSAGPRPSRSRPGHDHPDVLQEGQLADQERRAAVALVVGRPVERRGAADRGGDVRVAQGQAVVGPARAGPVGEAGLVERRPQEVARAVAGEDPARSGCRRGRPGPGPRSGPAPRGRRSPAAAGPSTARRRSGRPCPGRPARARRPAAGSAGRRRSRPRGPPVPPGRPRAATSAGACRAGARRPTGRSRPSPAGRRCRPAGPG